MGNTSKTLLDQVQATFRHTRAGSIKTRERYLETGRRLAKYLGEQYRVSNLRNLSDKHLEGYVRYLQSQNASVSHIKTELSAIRFIADHVGLKRPLEEARTFNQRMEIGQRHFRGNERLWKPNDLRIIEQAPARIRDVLIIARDMGLRVHEVHRIDVASARQAIKSEKLTVKGKNGRVRQVPVRGEVKEVLNRAIESTEPGHKLFVPPETGTHQAIAEVQYYIWSHRPEGSTARIHGLRHGYAQERFQEFRERGMSQRDAKLAVSELLGHSRIDVVDIYLSSY